MLGRLITSLNWTFGSLALVLAIAGPKMIDAFFSRVNDTEAINATAQIADGQRAYFALHKRNLEFSRYTADRILPNLNVQLNLQLSNYDFDGFYSEDGAYIVRAATRPQTLGGRDGVLPSYRSVRIYRRVLNKPEGGNSDEQTGWLPLSGKKAGILPLIMD